MLKESNSPRLSTLISTYFSFYFRNLASAQHWDAQYKAGDWAGLRSDPGQMGHHMVVLGYTLRAGPNPRILDVGQGPGRGRQPDTFGQVRDADATVALQDVEDAAIGLVELHMCRI